MATFIIPTDLPIFFFDFYGRQITGGELLEAMSFHARTWNRILALPHSEYVCATCGQSLPAGFVHADTKNTGACSTYIATYPL